MQGFAWSNQLSTVYERPSRPFVPRQPAKGDYGINAEVTAVLPIVQRAPEIPKPHAPKHEVQPGRRNRVQEGLIASLAAALCIGAAVGVSHLFEPHPKKSAAPAEGNSFGPAQAMLKQQLENSQPISFLPGKTMRLMHGNSDSVSTCVTSPIVETVPNPQDPSAAGVRVIMALSVDNPSKPTQVRAEYVGTLAADPAGKTAELPSAPISWDKTTLDFVTTEHGQVGQPVSEISVC